MKRLPRFFALALIATGCSKPSSEAPPTASATGSSRTGQPASSTSAAPAPAGAILTPEDVEAETEHRITEQNLESELDRLEREIQGE